jgi:hypothetical protein
MATIPEIITGDETQIRDSFTDIREEDIPEGKFFNISYKHYNKKICGINELESGSYKSFTKYLRKIGGNASIIDLREELKTNLKQINRSGEYGKLFSKLSDDIEVFEIILTSSNRLFFYIVENNFYIIALRAKHFEVGKNRR